MLFASLSTLPAFILYFVIALILTAAFIAAYIQITPYKEFELIQEGNTAAALSLGGAVTGFVLALSAVIKHSVNVVDLSIWGLIAPGSPGWRAANPRGDTSEPTTPACRKAPIPAYPRSGRVPEYLQFSASARAVEKNATSPPTAL